MIDKGTVYKLAEKSVHLIEGDDDLINFVKEFYSLLDDPLNSPFEPGYFREIECITNTIFLGYTIEKMIYHYNPLYTYFAIEKRIEEDGTEKFIDSYICSLQNCQNLTWERV